ncbi:mechanosensitive ion channel protein MscS [Lysobacter pythonis]|uniref:Mechanosensitive ion channel protein MscS n=1 Tax=Solilutibacter pythonis TaxID=2483112 RepID=A0A3M2HYU7_9GAMM|nr:mechanosensitive ion channel domain-containing protein [Lysobacter pythonis]RMH92830.1 mechanosensitive ion channel protein MscS [Lysobacter pythonis]
MQPDAASQVERVAERVRDGVDTRALSGLQPLLEYRLVELGGSMLTVGGVLSALLAVVAMLLLSRLAGSAIKRYGKRNPRANPASLYTVSRILHYLLLALGVMWALDALGIPMSKFTVFAGALGVGLGFGLQQIFSNFVSGLILLFDRSLKVGDFIQLDDNARGVVKAINIRSTQITSNDNIDMLVPNSEFVSKRVTNWTYRSVNRRIRVPFGVAYGVDKELVKKAALEAASNVPFTLSMTGDKAPQVWLVEFGDSSVNFILAVWLTEAAARRNVAVKAAYMWELDTALKKYGIEIPFPQQDLRLRSLFGLEGAQALAALRGQVPERDDDASPENQQLGEEERARLARNDARADAEREIETDALAERQLQQARRDHDGPG